jgi:hypothetical protein
MAHSKVSSTPINKEFIPNGIEILSSYRAVNSLSQLMVYRDVVALCSEMHAKHINTLCEQNVEFMSVKFRTESNH